MKWRDCSLQRLNHLSLSVTYYFDSFAKSNKHVKNKEQNMLHDRGDVFIKVSTFFTVMPRDYLGSSQKSMVERFWENS